MCTLRKNANKKILLCNNFSFCMGVQHIFCDVIDKILRSLLTRKLSLGDIASESLKTVYH